MDLNDEERKGFAMRLELGTGATALAIFLAVSAPAAVAQESGESLFGTRSASVTYGPYVRLEAGAAGFLPGDAYWLPHGISDPRINFDADAGTEGFGAVALGYDWQTGIRADVSVFATGTSNVTAPCASASDGSSCDIHTDMSEASVKTTGVMGNLFYAPFEARGSNSIFQPFVVGGVGIASNEVGEWTRENLANTTRPTRTFEGDTTTDLAWSVGVGASLQTTKPGRWPILVEASWRWYDFGTASGGATPLPGNGTEEPRQPFTFDNTAQVFSFGLRIPLQRY